MPTLSDDILKYIDRSILCWLASASNKSIPNVSPKEVFAAYNSDAIIIANIASPQSVRNILENKNVCVSFIDVLVQKGYQLTGTAQILKKEDEEFASCETILLRMTKGKYPFVSITKIKVDKIKQILAPSYIMYPETTEEEQIKQAIKAYKLDV